MQRDGSGTFRVGQIWAFIAVVAALVIAGLQFVRVNPPQQAILAEQPEQFVPTTGKVLDGTYTIAAGEMMTIKVNADSRAKVAGTFRSIANDGRLNCLLLTAEAFESWKAGQPYRSLAETGYLPGGRLNVNISPGSYVLVLDNRNSAGETAFNADISVDQVSTASVLIPTSSPVSSTPAT